MAIRDSEKMRAYQEMASSTIAKPQGKLKAHGGVVTVLQGAMPERGTVIVDFPTKEG